MPTAIALEDAKRLALEQAGTYLESLTIVENNAVTIDRIKVIARGTAKLVPGSIRKQYETIDPSTGAQRLVLEAQFLIDPNKVADEIARVKNSNLPDLGAVQSKYDAVIAEDQRLQAELLQTSNETERVELIDKYQQSRNRFYALQWYSKGMDEIGYILSDGTTWIPEKDAKRIIQLFDRGIEIDPFCGENYVMRGFTKFYLRDLDGSINDINKSIELLPPDQDDPLIFAKETLELLLEFKRIYYKETPIQ